MTGFDAALVARLDQEYATAKANFEEFVAETVTLLDRCEGDSLKAYSGVIGKLALAMTMGGPLSGLAGMTVLVLMLAEKKRAERDGDGLARVEGEGL